MKPYKLKKTNNEDISACTGCMYASKREGCKHIDFEDPDYIRVCIEYTENNYIFVPIFDFLKEL